MSTLFSFFHVLLVLLLAHVLTVCGSIFPSNSSVSVHQNVKGKAFPGILHGGPNNACNYMANDSDMKKLGLLQKVSDYCSSVFGVYPDGVHVNQDDGYGFNMCLNSGTPFIDFKWIPSGEISITGTSTFKNNGDLNVSHTFELNGSYGEAITVSTTNSVEISADVQYGISFIVDAHLTFEGTYSFQHTTDKTSDYQLGFSNSDTVIVPPHCSSSDTMVATMIQYTGSVSTSVCLNGYARCQYGKRVEGHYYWFIDLNDLGLPDTDRCWKQSGNIAGKSAINAQSEMTTKC